MTDTMTTKFRQAEAAIRTMAAELDCKVLTIQFDNIGNGRFWFGADSGFDERPDPPQPTLGAAFQAARKLKDGLQ